MSGHSKWSTIKHKKALTDAKKGKAFSKLSVLVSVAAKTGGDVSMNPTLRLAVDRAKQAGMTKDIIERAIKRGKGELGGAVLEEMVYEVYGPGGVGIMVEAVIDNKNRTVAEIKAVLNKFGGKLAEPGAVSYLFEKQGVVSVEKSELSADDLTLTAIDAGAKDIDESGESITIYTDPANLEVVRKAVEDLGAVVKESEIAFQPKQSMAIDEGKKDAIIKLLEALDDLDDVTAVATNI